MSLGKITYFDITNEDGRIGLTTTLEGKGWGVGDFKGHASYDPDEYSKWTPQERYIHLGVVFLFIRDCMEQAKVRRMKDMIGIPVEVIFDGNLLKSWRILEEVL